MKTLLFPMALALLTCASSTYAQNSAIKIGATYISNGAENINCIGGGVTFEYRLSKKFTVAGVLDYTSGQGSDYAFYNNLTFSQTYKSPLIGFRPEGRFYVKESMKGFFLGAGVGFGSYREGYLIPPTNGGTDAILLTDNRTLIYPALLLGFNLQPTPNLCFELSGGVGPIFEEESVLIPAVLRVGYSF